MKPLAIFLCIILRGVAYGQPSSTELGGYVKYLFSSITDSPSGSSIDHLLHARLNSKWFPVESFSANMELRFRGYYGETVERTPQFANTLKNRSGYGSLDATIWSGRKTLGYGEIDRLYINWAPKDWQATLGRQRIAWGTNLVWNVIDVFNPLSVLDFDYEERPAVDAIHIQYYTGEVTKIAVAFTPKTATSKSIAGLLWTMNRWNYDLHLVAGERDGSDYVGLGWAGDISGGGFRGEGLLSEMTDVVTGEPVAGTMFSGALSGDYTFVNTFYLHTELLYNSKGVTSNAAAFRTIAQRMRLLSPSRWSLFQEVSYDLSPLVRGSAFVILNPDDNSVALVPSLTWSAMTNLDIAVIALLFSGDMGSEFGGLGRAVYLRGKLSM